MKIITEGNVNLYYLQTLCLLFFPGAKFSPSEEIAKDVPIVHVKQFTVDGVCYAEARLSVSDKTEVRYFSEPVTEERSEKKAGDYAVARAFFEAASKLFGYTPPWGLLTGVRPTKLAFDRMDRGMNKEQTVKSLRQEYLLFPKKAILAADIARFEAKVIKNYSDKDCSLYISIPFCPTRCSYCSFVSYTTKKLLSLIPDYIKALKDELTGIAKRIKALDMTLRTIYIGGGTPTTLTVAQLDELLSHVDGLFNTAALDEYTLEAGRPDTITEDKLKCAIAHNVTRISVNPQTLNDDILKEIGRAHTTDMFLSVYDMAKSSGIKYINTDLIIGLPGDDFVNYSDTLDRMITLDPENITVHTFCAKRSAEILNKGEGIFDKNRFELSKCVDYTQIVTKKAGYIPYYMYRQKNAVGNFENVGFCKKGAEGIYNILMMEEVNTIFAAGAGAVTKLTRDKGDRIERIFNPKYPYEYLKRDLNEYLSLLDGRCNKFYFDQEEEV